MQFSSTEILNLPLGSDTTKETENKILKNRTCPFKNYHGFNYRQQMAVLQNQWWLNGR